MRGGGGGEETIEEKRKGKQMNIGNFTIAVLSPQENYSLKYVKNFKRRKRKVRILKNSLQKFSKFFKWNNSKEKKKLNIYFCQCHLTHYSFNQLKTTAR